MWHPHFPLNGVKKYLTVLCPFSQAKCSPYLWLMVNGQQRPSMKENVALSITLIKTAVNKIHEQITPADHSIV